MTSASSSSHRTFHPFPRLPPELQCLIWHIFTPPPTIIQAYFLPISAYHEPILTGGPAIQALHALATIKHPSLKSLPSPRPKAILLKRRNSVPALDEDLAAFPVQTVYLRPELDILYLPNLDYPTRGTLDLEHFVSCTENHELTRIALLSSTVSMPQFRHDPDWPGGPWLLHTGRLIRGLPNLKVVYAVDGEYLGSERKVTEEEYNSLRMERLREEMALSRRKHDCVFEMEDVREGRMDRLAVELHRLMWVSERAERHQLRWQGQVERERRFIEELGEEEWVPPKLECKEIKRVKLCAPNHEPGLNFG